jgi:hypothetical protein
VTQRNPRHTGRPPRRQTAPFFSTHRGLVACVTALAVVLVVAGFRLPAVFSHKSGGSTAPQSQSVRYLGVYEPGSPSTYSGVEEFAKNVGRQPNLVSYYSGWGEKFQASFAGAAESHGATTIVQVDPDGISLAKIAAGDYDKYLTSFADQVASFKQKVVISFGHEMNGYWETWGYHHQSPTAFVAAWRHIVDVFRQHGANNVTWLWQVNSASSLTGPVRDWWPGSQYVTWIGVSGYYYVPGDAYDNVFTPVVTAIRQFSQAPLLIAETAVGPQAGQTKGIENLFAGIRSNRVLGLVWFDQHSYGGLYKGENWRLEGNSSALTTFRKALAG